VVHSLIEKYKDKQFILTGSSARKIKRKGVDLLAGRVVIYNLYPFMAKELGNLFSFQKVLQKRLRKHCNLLLGMNEPNLLLKY
jgi:predicted AAA+ superfamily ATPase